MAPKEGERRLDPSRRKQRIQRGGTTAVAAPAIVWFLHESKVLPDMPQEVALAVGASVGALLAWVSVCFDEMRGLLLEYIRERMHSDRRK